MDHVHPGAAFSAPMILAGLFFAGTLFYVFRLLNAQYLRKVNGYHDRENEFWHGACLLGMVACLTPALMPLPETLWLYLFPVGTLWYLLRAFTWGRRLAYNKQWYDLAHAAMLFGMWWMFAAPLAHPAITVAFTAYWVWFGSYYAWRIREDFKNPHWLSFGQDIAHFGMAAVMAIMTVWPHALMMHGH